jgi:ribosomal protein S18 acetylase RimI-like enzyme
VGVPVGVAEATTAPAVVRVLGPTDLEVAAAVLSRAFEQEPGNLALLPDPETRRLIVEASARNTLRSALRFGTVHGAMAGGDLAAIALWHAPGARTSVGDRVRNVAGLSRGGRAVARGIPHAAAVVLRNVPEGIAMVRERGRAVARASEGATWHLAFLGTAPDHRGRGLARALLDRQLARCDEDGAAVWLETTDPVNPPIYERFGFETVRHIAEAAWLPGLWVMRREPRAR